MHSSACAKQYSALISNIAHHCELSGGGGAAVTVNHECSEPGRSSETITGARHHLNTESELLGMWVQGRVRAGNCTEFGGAESQVYS